MIFDEARERLSRRILRFGYCEKRSEYLQLLEEADVVVSTARQENFGIAIVEAILAGATPLLPYRLSYPELLPRETHASLLYRGREELREKLETVLRAPGDYAQAREVARNALWRYRWKEQARRFDFVLERIARGDGAGAN